jgi:quercetin dioxygenase-like cupin family protein
MRIVTRNDTQTRRGPAEWFTGSVWMDASPAGPSPDASFFRVFFEPGARTNWHTHPEGQILFVLTGTCRVATEGEPPADVEAGGIVYFAPGERHWHGANPDSYMVHAAVSPAANSDGGTDWLEPVTDEQYAAGA